MLIAEIWINANTENKFDIVQNNSSQMIRQVGNKPNQVRQTYLQEETKVNSFLCSNFTKILAPPPTWSVNLLRFTIVCSASK